MRITLITISGIILFFLGLFILQGVGLANFKFFAPKWQDARTEVWRNSQAYQDGTIRDLQNLTLEYQKASPEQKPMLLNIIRHRASVVPPGLLPLETRAIIN